MLKKMKRVGTGKKSEAMSFTEQRKCVACRHRLLAWILMFVAFVVAFVEVARMSSSLGAVGRMISSPIVFAFFCLIPAFVLFRSRRFSVNYSLLLFCVACAISLVFNNPVTNYLMTLRFGLFLAMLCLLSPLVDNVALREFRRYLWRFSLILCQVAVTVTLVVYLVTLAVEGKGALLKVISHPMLLSAVSALVGVVMTWRLLAADTEGCRYRRLVVAADIVSLVAAVLLMIWGGSRGAILSFVVADIYILISLSAVLKRRYWVLLTIVGSILLSIFIGGKVTARVKIKFEIGKEHNSIIFSRQQLWQSRIEEFAESPVVGIGFTNVTRKSTLYGNTKVLSLNPDVREEPGSSWLSVLSNTGIIGFLLLVYWNVELLRMVRRRRLAGDTQAICYGALLLLFIIEGVFEGWILYAGAFSFFLYWLLGSRIVDCGTTLRGKSGLLSGKKKIIQRR